MLMRHIYSFFCAALVCGLMAACAAQNPSPTATPNMAGHAMPTANPGLPYDAAFMDAMIAHHQGALDMTYQARQEAQRIEVKDFLELIALEQAGEIKQMRAWRAEWYPSLAASAIAPNDMAISNDAATPFDIRFINAMIPHHQAAISMATEAKTKTARPELLKLADAIIKTQTAEIEQMQKWKADWAK